MANGGEVRFIPPEYYGLVGASRIPQAVMEALLEKEQREERDRILELEEQQAENNRIFRLAEQMINLGYEPTVVAGLLEGEFPQFATATEGHAPRIGLDRLIEDYKIERYKAAPEGSVLRNIMNGWPIFTEEQLTQMRDLKVDSAVAQDLAEQFALFRAAREAGATPEQAVRVLGESGLRKFQGALSSLSGAPLTIEEIRTQLANYGDEGIRNVMLGLPTGGVEYMATMERLARLLEENRVELSGLQIEQAERDLAAPSEEVNELRNRYAADFQSDTKLPGEWLQAVMAGEELPEADARQFWPAYQRWIERATVGKSGQDLLRLYKDLDDMGIPILQTDENKAQIAAAAINSAAGREIAVATRAEQPRGWGGIFGTKEVWTTNIDQAGLAEVVNPSQAGVVEETADVEVVARFSAEQLLERHSNNVDSALGQLSRGRDQLVSLYGEDKADEIIARTEAIIKEQTGGGGGVRTPEQQPEMETSDSTITSRRNDVGSRLERNQKRQEEIAAKLGTELSPGQRANLLQEMDTLRAQNAELLNEYGDLMEEGITLDLSGIRDILSYGPRNNPFVGPGGEPGIQTIIRKLSGSDRIRELLDKKRDGTITSEEQRELDTLLRNRGFGGGR